MPIPSNTRVALDVQIAPGANLADGPLSWPWVSLDTFTYGGRVHHRLRKESDLTITSGRSSESDALPQPGSVQFTVDNADNAFTPGNPTGLYYPSLKLGLPCRILLPGSTTALVTDPTTADGITTPNHSSLQITGDIDLRYEGDIDWWQITASIFLVGKWYEPTNNRSYQLWIFQGLLVLTWSTDGTAYENAISTAVFPWAKGRHAVRATLDVSNAGNHVIQFFTAATRNDTWQQLGSTLTVPGTTSIYSGTAPAVVGGTTNLTGPVGRTFWAEIRDGISGTVVANPTPDTQAHGTTIFADTATPVKTWTTTGTAQVTNRRVRRLLEVSQLEPVVTQDEPVKVARTTVTASGVLRRLQQGEQPLSSVLYRAVTSPALGDAVIAAWPMEDESGAATWSSPIAGVQPAVFHGDVTLSSDDSLASAKALPHVADNDGLGWTGTIPARTATQYLADYFVNIPTPETSPTETILFDLSFSGTIKTWRWSVNSATVAVTGLNATGASSYSATAAPTEFFNGWTQISLNLTQNGGNIDISVAWLSIDGNTYGWTGSVAGTLGRPTGVGSLFPGPPTDGMSFGYMVISTGLGAGWLGWNDGANAAYVGETAAHRIGRLCAEQGIPVQLIGNPADSTLMGPQGALTFTDLIKECADADGGAVGEIADRLGISYRTRASLYNQEPALVLDRDDRAIAHLVPVEDDRLRRTHVTASRPAGSSATYVDPDWDSGTDPAYPDSVTVNVEADAQLGDQAAWRVHLGQDTVHYETVQTGLTTKPHTSDGADVLADRVEAWLDVDYGDLVRAVNPPDGFPTGPVDQLVLQLTDRLASDTWVGEIVGRPAGAFEVGVVEDEVLGRADTEGSELATSEAALAAGASDTWSVATTSGNVWIDSASYAAMFPFDITIAGEVVTVTAISGTSSPQTFTVTRGVNGITKAHPAGTPLSLTHPWVAAL